MYLEVQEYSPRVGLRFGFPLAAERPLYSECKFKILAFSSVERV